MSGAENGGPVNGGSMDGQQSPEEATPGGVANPAEAPLSGFEAIERAVADLRAGKPVVVVDDEDRENEGDLIMAAEFATPDKVAFFLHHTSGYLCAPITAERADELDLPLMSSRTPRATARRSS